MKERNITIERFKKVGFYGIIGLMFAVPTFAVVSFFVFTGAVHFIHTIYTGLFILGFLIRLIVQTVKIRNVRRFISKADRAVASVIDFEDTGIHIRRSHRYYCNVIVAYNDKNLTRSKGETGRVFTPGEARELDRVRLKIAYKNGCNKIVILDAV